MKNIKKLLKILMLLIMILLTGCDNNGGPFTTRQENGKMLLYSNNKPAKGGITNTVENRTGNLVVVSEIYYDKGIPNGNFILRNLAGYTVVEAKGTWEEEDVFNGEIKTFGQTIEDSFNGGIKDLNESATGKFYINRNYLIEYNGTQIDGFILKFPLEKVLYNGSLSTSEGKLKKENGQIIEAIFTENEILYYVYQKDKKKIIIRINKKNDKVIQNSQIGFDNVEEVYKLIPKDILKILKKDEDRS